MKNKLLMAASAATIALAAPAYAQETPTSANTSGGSTATDNSLDGSQNTATDNSLTDSQNSNDNSTTNTDNSLADSQNTDNSLSDSQNADNSDNSSAAGDRLAANNGSTATDNTNNAVTDNSNRSDDSDNSSAAGDRLAANNGGTATDNTNNSVTDNSDNSDNSSASAERLAANNGGTATDNTNNAITDNSDRSVANGVVAANGGGTATLTVDTSDNSTLTGAARTQSVFGDGALVASATLSSYVTGVNLTFNGSTDRAGAVDNSLSNSGAAYQNFAGVDEGGTLASVAPALDGAGVATADGVLRLVSGEGGARVLLEGAGTDVTHLIGQSLGAIVSNTLDNRSIDTSTVVDVALSGLTPDAIGGSLAQVENLALSSTVSLNR